MKLITAFIHHVRTSEAINALHDSGYKNMAMLDVKGTLKPLGEQELAYTSETGEVISEVQLSLACQDDQVDAVTTIIRKAGKIGDSISGWVYVNPIERRLPIDGH